MLNWSTIKVFADEKFTINQTSIKLVNIEGFSRWQINVVKIVVFVFLKV